MLNDLFHLSIGPLELVIRAGAIYLFVLLLLRISGKRQLGQMSATEFVALLLISNAVQNSMNGGDNSLLGGLILAAVLIFLSWAISVLTFRHAQFRAVFEGVPTLVVRKGKLIESHMAQERLSLAELKMLLRKQGVHSLEEIDSAILESDGSLSITHVRDLKGTSQSRDDQEDDLKA